MRLSVALVLRAASVAVLFLTLSACNRSGPPVAATTALLVGNHSEPGDLDPAFLDSQQSFNVVMSLMEGLAQYDPKTCLPTPGVAESWAASADNLAWTFRLRPTARWSNGDAVVAQDFVYAFRRMLSPKLAAENANVLFALKNGEAFYKGVVTDFTQVGATVLDDRTLVLRLERPVPYLPQLVCHAAWYPVHRATIEKFGRIDQRGTLWTRPGNYVGNGPFVLAEWKPGQIIRATKSSTYWNHEHVRLAAVHFFPVDSEATEEAMFRAGQLHVTSTIPPTKISGYQRDPALGKLLQQHVTLGTYFYGFNVSKSPLNDPRVRRALASAIDRRAIVEHVALGGHMVADHLTPPRTAGFEPNAHLAYDPARARALLAEAGFPEGHNFPQLEVLYNTNDNHRQIAEAIQQMWRRELGIRVILQNQDGKTVRENQRAGNYQITRFSWVGDYLDPSTFLDILAGDDGNNQTRWKNPAYDRLLAQAREAPDQAARFALFEKCEQILVDECPIAPIYFQTQSALVKPEVKGWFGNVLNLHPLADVYLEP